MAKVPYAIAVNRADTVDPAGDAQLRAALDLDKFVPVVPCDATDRESVKRVLLALLLAVDASLKRATAAV